MCEVCIQIWVHSVFRRNNCGVCCIHVGGNFISEVIYKSTYVRIHAHIGATRWAATGSDGSVEEGGEWVEYRDSEAGSGWEREAGPGPRQEGKVDSGFFTSCSGRCSDLRVVRVNTSVSLRALALRCSQHIFPKHTLHRSVRAYALYLYVHTCKHVHPLHFLTCVTRSALLRLSWLNLSMPTCFHDMFMALIGL